MFTLCVQWRYEESITIDFNYVWMIHNKTVWDQCYQENIGKPHFFLGVPLLILYDITFNLQVTPLGFGSSLYYMLLLQYQLEDMFIPPYWTRYQECSCQILLIMDRRNYQCSESQFSHISVPIAKTILTNFTMSICDASIWALGHTRWSQGRIMLLYF